MANYILQSETMNLANEMQTAAGLQEETVKICYIKKKPDKIDNFLSGSLVNFIAVGQRWAVRK